MRPLRREDLSAADTAEEGQEGHDRGNESHPRQVHRPVRLRTGRRHELDALNQPHERRLVRTAEKFQLLGAPAKKVGAC